MKEPTATKLFVGQVPRDWTESQLREIFEPFGEIHSFNLLIDKHGSGQHKGCAFLTYFNNESAKAACEGMHEKRTLPGARGPIQVRPASSETSEDSRKLFVGMISKTTTAEDLQEMFSKFGDLEDVAILKGPEGVSKGCAFLKFETRLQAQNAIRSMHNSVTLEGCRSPMVVKLADTEKDKQAKKNIYAPAGVGGGGVGAGAGAVMSGAFAGLGGGGAGVGGAGGPSPAAALGAGVATLAQQVAYYQQIFAQMGLPQVIAAAPGGGLVNPLGAAQLPSAAPTQSLNASAAAAYGAGPSTSGSGVGSSDALQSAYSGVQQYLNTALPTTAYGLNLGSYGAASSQPTSSATSLGGGQSSMYMNNTKKTGPENANLFIYHIPSEFNDNDLMQTFAPFGNVISAKVFIDHKTGTSKGFGFVSYDNAGSASKAISAMDGLAIGSNRLKVQLKTPKGSNNKPY